MTACVRWHLVRHGESMWNAAGLLQGRTADVGLTMRGGQQSCAVAAALAGASVAAVLTSDQRRCRETAEVVAARHGLAVRPEPALREQAHGCWEGRPSAVYGPLLAAAGPDWAPPGGETARSLHARVAALVGRLHREPLPDGDLVVVTHGETVRALLAVLAGHPPEAMPRELPGNGSVHAVAVPRPAPVGVR
ncbi:histidine phosphatase family protein [Pseudonocardia sp.]|uniref:histidine phosphatase family protein n=1 Tax=Pseudonocardia sp. TaxID=60912 RepID=UPI003D0E4806